MLSSQLVPAVSVARSSTQRWIDLTSWPTSPTSGDRRWIAPARSWESRRYGSASSTRVCPRVMIRLRFPTGACPYRLAVATAPLVKIIRSFRPHVMTTYNESDGGYRHPDHIMCHKISVAAFDAASDPDAYPDLGAAWQPLSSTTRLPSIVRGRWRWIGRWRRLESPPYTERLRDWPEDPPARGADHDAG